MFDFNNCKSSIRLKRNKSIKEVECIFIRFTFAMNPLKHSGQIFCQNLGIEAQPSEEKYILK